MAEKIKCVKINHILKGDSHTQRYTVEDASYPKCQRDLIGNSKTFFEMICVKNKKSIKINGKKISGEKIDDWLEDNIKNAENCILLVIEGYAGCGKSTWVQSFLYDLFNDFGYDYSYYNYNVGTHADKKDNPIKDSLISGFISQMTSVLKNEDGKKVYEKFVELTVDPKLKNLDLNSGIWVSFTGTSSIRTSVEKVFNASNEIEVKNALNDFYISVFEQLNRECFDIYRLLCIDYLWRLAQFIANPSKFRNNLYVCYDNLDAIYNNDVLCEFRDNLINFRYNLSIFVNELNQSDNDIYSDVVPPFIIFTTYRKITESRSRSINIEMQDDMKNHPDFVKMVEVSHLYNYQEIVRKRIDHFRKRIKSDTICGHNSEKLIKQMDSIELLLDLNFFSEGYSKLWNNNFRSCSNVLSKIIEEHYEDVQMCIDLSKKKTDGFNENKSCYYGASSVLLNVICKILCKEKIWDPDHLDLVNHTKIKSARKTSFSRLVLTYLSNEENNSISIFKIFNIFEKVFGYQYICKVIGQMLKRVPDEIWRRPIYYSKNSFINESQVYKRLVEQHIQYQNNDTQGIVEFSICESGKTFVENIVSHFEFYSARFTVNKPSLYCIKSVDDLNEVLFTVYEQVEACSKNQEDFINKYVNEYNISYEEYLKLPFNPRTRKGNYQLHIERIIFSHIAYLNHYRLFLIKNDRTIGKKKKTNDFNEKVLEYIEKYLLLYTQSILPFSEERKEVAKIMQQKANSAIDGKGDEKYISIDAED